MYSQKIGDGLKQSGRKNRGKQSGKENIIQGKREALGGQWYLREEKWKEAGKRQRISSQTPTLHFQGHKGFML